MKDTTTQPQGVAASALFAVALPDTRGRYCYLTTGEGDPPRTYSPEHANSYPTRIAAAASIIEARKLTPLKPRTMIVVPHPSNVQTVPAAAGDSESTQEPSPPLGTSA